MSNILNSKQKNLFLLEKLAKYLLQSQRIIGLIDDEKFSQKILGEKSLSLILFKPYCKILNFCENVANGKINYDEVHYDENFLKNSIYCSEKIKFLIKKLKDLKNKNLESYIFISHKNSYTDDKLEYISTTIERELNFLLVDLIQAYEEIKFLAEKFDIYIATDFAKIITEKEGDSEFYQISDAELECKIPLQKISA